MNLLGTGLDLRLRPQTSCLPLRGCRLCAQTHYEIVSAIGLELWSSVAIMHIYTFECSSCALKICKIKKHNSAQFTVIACTRSSGKLFLGKTSKASSLERNKTWSKLSRNSEIQKLSSAQRNGFWNKLLIDPNPVKSVLICRSSVCNMHQFRYTGDTLQVENCDISSQKPNFR